MTGSQMLNHISVYSLDRSFQFILKLALRADYLSDMQCNSKLK